jgi:hypothetical protein
MANSEGLAYHWRLAIRHARLALPAKDPMSDPAHALTIQFLAWVAERPRSYADAMEAWRSSCPRLSIWEDAILDGLVEFDGAGGVTRNASRVVLTSRGHARLVASRDPRAGDRDDGRSVLKVSSR